MIIKNLIKESYESAKNNGFYDKNIGAEILELISHLRKEIIELETAVINNNYNNNDMNSFNMELSDIIIRIASFCGYANIDLEKHINTKYLYNKTRPYKHGKG